jgi:type IV secretion system protein VirB3
MRKGLAQDTLFLACTRPAMTLGVPIEALAIIMIVTTLVFIVMKNPLYLALGVPVWLLCKALAGQDHNCFRALFLWVETKGRCRNTSLWGGSSASPLPVRRRFKPREVRVVL